MFSLKWEELEDKEKCCTKGVVFKRMSLAGYLY